MAKKTDAKTKSKPAKTPAAKKPATKKEVALAMKAATKKPAAVPPLLKAGHVMTEKKLANLPRKKGAVQFLLRYPLSFFLETEDCEGAIDADVTARACPPGFLAFETDFAPWEVNRGRREIDLLVTAYVERQQGPPAETGPQPTDAPRNVDPTAGGEAEGPAACYGERPPATPEQRAAVDAIGPADVQTSPEPAGADAKVQYVPVKAHVHSDDREVSANFDAHGWLAQATDDDILDLAREEYKYDSVSDGVAEFCAAHDPKVKEVMDYVAERNGKLKTAGREEEGFGCSVTEDDVLEWVEKHRPYLLPKLAEIKDGKEEAAEPVTTGTLPE